VSGYTGRLTAAAADDRHEIKESARNDCERRSRLNGTPLGGQTLRSRSYALI
jgi:hypothetical protein